MEKKILWEERFCSFVEDLIVVSDIIPVAVQMWNVKGIKKTLLTSLLPVIIRVLLNLCKKHAVNLDNKV